MQQFDPLTTYLKMYRKRLGLSQGEVAHILGAAQDGTAISRHEMGKAYPLVSTLIKYEILYGASRDDLFEQLRGQLAREMLPNIRGLISNLERKRPQTTRMRKKIGYLRALIVAITEEST